MKHKAPGIVATNGAGSAGETRARRGADRSSGDDECGATQMLEVAAHCAAELLTKSSGSDHFGSVWPRVSRLLDLAAFGCFELHDDGKHLEPGAASGFAPDITAKLAAELLPFVPTPPVSSPRTEIIDISNRDESSLAALLGPFGFSGGTVTPLVLDGRVLGLLLFVSRSRTAFTATEAALVDIVSNCLSVAYDARRRGRQEARSDAAKEEFIAVLAHEIRNPLAPMRNALQIMRSNDQHPSAVGRSAYAMIERQVERIACLADDLFDTNQVAYGKVELEKERVALTAIIEQAVANARHWTEAGQHELAVALPTRPIGVYADQKRLTRVFSNLLNQIARHLGRRGRIGITVELKRDHVIVLIQATAGESGVGLRELLSAAVGGAVLDGRSPGGFTASVALVRHFVEMHAGTITARGDADGTVEFAVSLPVAEASAAHAPVAEGSLDTGSGPRRILVADDNADSAESMGMLLRLMGNDVRIANDGLDAVAQASTFQPDVVLLDIAMPRLDGYEAARRIREQDWSQDTLIVAITGWGARDDGGRRALAAGFDRHFTKPIDPAELRKLLNEQHQRH